MDRIKILDQLRSEMIHHDDKVIRSKKKKLKLREEQISKDHSDFMKDIRYVEANHDEAVIDHKTTAKNEHEKKIHHPKMNG